MNILDEWWSIDRLVHDTGEIANGSGNDGFKHVIDSIRISKPKEYNKKVKILPQCCFDSYLWNHYLPKWEKLFKKFY